MTICINGLLKSGKGTTSELATSPLPSWGAKTGWICYTTPAFSGVPNKGDKIRIGCLTPTFLEQPETSFVRRTFEQICSLRYEKLSDCRTGQRALCPSPHRSQVI